MDSLELMAHFFIESLELFFDLSFILLLLKIFVVFSQEVKIIDLVIDSLIGLSLLLKLLSKSDFA